MSENFLNLERMIELKNIKFNKNINLLYIFRDFDLMINVILVTNEDEVYCYGYNNFGMLGFGHEDPISIYTPNKELSFKKIIDFNNSHHHTIARNSVGKIYSWGSCKLLGNGEKVYNISKPELNKYLTKENIIDMCCGSNHTLVLTSINKVYAWGGNIYGQIGNGKVCHLVSEPYKLDEFNEEDVKAISCGSFHSMALTVSGSVYSWGHNNWGQLGANSERVIENKPKRIQIEAEIEKISCGLEYSLLLSREGDIYVFGRNNISQLGLKSNEQKKLTPIKLNHPEKFIEVASHSQYNTSAALSKNGLYYVWGDCREEWTQIEQKILPSKLRFEEGIMSEIEETQNKVKETKIELRETELECLEDLFVKYCGVTKKPLQYTSHSMNNFIPNGKYIKYWTETKKLGEGDYGTVFKVTHRLIKNTNFAMKKIEIKDEDSIKELILSPSILELNSDRLVRYYDVWYENDFEFKNGFRVYTEKNLLYIQMDLCHKTMKEIQGEIKENTKLYSDNELTNLGYFIQSGMYTEILEGVKYLHSKEIIHRDLTPRNILVKREINGNCIKIADFGLAKIHELNKSHTQDKGNQKYAAPEKLDGTKYDKKSDIYSLGVILEKFFDIDYNRSITYSSDMKPKYECLIELISRMTTRNPQTRPNCDKVLEERENWDINESKINLKEELSFLSNINDKDRSYVQNIIFSKLSYMC